MNSEDNRNYRRLPHSGRANPFKREDAHSLKSVLEIIWGKKLIVLAIASGLAALASYHHRHFPSYPAMVTLYVQSNDSNPLQAAIATLSEKVSFGSGSSGYVAKNVLYLKSFEFYVQAAKALKAHEQFPRIHAALRLDKVGSRESLSTWFYEDRRAAGGAPASIEVDDEELAKYIQRKTLVEKGTSDNIKLTVTTGDPESSVVIANLLADVGVKSATHEDLKDLNEARTYLAQEVENATERIKATDQAIIEYKSKNNIASMDLSQHELSAKMTDLQKDLNESTIKFEQNRRLMLLLEAEELKRENRIFSKGSRAGFGPEVKADLRKRIEALQRQRSIFEAQGYANNSWSIRELDRQITEQLKKLKAVQAASPGNEPQYTATDDRETLSHKLNNLRRENRDLAARISTLRQSIQAERDTRRNMPQDEQTIMEFKRKLDLEQKLFQELKTRYIQVQVLQISAANKFRVLDRATLTNVPNRLNETPKLILAFLLGLVLSGFIAVGIEEISLKIRNRSYLEQFNIDFLGSVPRMKRSVLAAIGQALGPSKRSLAEVICLSDSNSPEAMAFKYLRARVLGIPANPNAPGKVVALLSATSGEGKTYISANLAACLSQLGKRTLLIDSDLRKPSLSTMFGLKGSQGLGDWMSGAAPDPRSLIVADVAPGLDLLPAGGFLKNTTELFSGDRFASLLEKLRHEYDFIVMDTSPALAVVDSVLIARHADAAIISIAWQKTRLEHIAKTVEKLQQLGQRSVYYVTNLVNDRDEYVYARGNAASGMAPAAALRVVRPPKFGQDPSKQTKKAV